MNLIDQLGGYDVVKKAYTKLIQEQKDLITCGSVILVKTDIESLLLQHRRENNIYEVGDKVLITDDFHDKDVIDLLFNIFSVNQEDRIAHISVDFKNNEGGMTHYGISGQWFEHMQHATDAEIKARRRL